MALTDFLLGRIADDEAIAWANADLDFGGWELLVTFDRDYSTPDALAINPTRVLAQCKANRRIVDLHSGGLHGVHYCQPDDHSAPHRYTRSEPCLTLRALALPYAAHPDYRDEWKP